MNSSFRKYSVFLFFLSFFFLGGEGCHIMCRTSIEYIHNHHVSLSVASKTKKNEDVQCQILHFNLSQNSMNAINEKRYLVHVKMGT